MTQINDLTAATALAASDQLPLWAGGDTMRASLALLTAYLQGVLVFTPGQLVPQYAAPLTGATVAVATGNTWLVVTPAGTIAALTVTLPASPAAGDEVLITSSQIVTALTLAGSGAPTALAANGFARMRYDGVLGVWRRAG